jgi:hypothetical protein
MGLGLLLALFIEYWRTISAEINAYRYGCSILGTSPGDKIKTLRSPSHPLSRAALRTSRRPRTRVIDARQARPLRVQRVTSTNLGS